ncbi:hypothetical protein ACFSGX_10855 [Sphingomonas arantia]|uniref:Glycosyl transferase n=1 Tax=Sphingomonas arantia TaxID=1460676 RepID=A0ABW4U0B8_9SPHN
MTNYVVLRASPDWATFDLEETRPFLRLHKLDENLVIDFARIWDATFRLSYRMVRARLKALTLVTIEAVHDATVLRYDAFDAGAITAQDRIIFHDDDDWLAPHVFEELARLPQADGYRWGSIRIGLDFDLTAPGAGILALRPLSDIVYTNNYAVGGAAFLTRGREAMFEHSQAARAFAQPDMVVTDSSDYLSCAVKHPCSTLAAKWAMREPAFHRDPAAFVAPFVSRLRVAEPAGPSAWTAAPIAELRDIMDEL